MIIVYNCTKTFVFGRSVIFMTRTHKITHRIMALVLCAVLVLTSGGTGLGSILTSELWDSLAPTAQAAVEKSVNSYDLLKSAINEANNSTQQYKITLSGSWSGGSIDYLPAISGNVILDLNGKTVSYSYTGEGKNGNSYKHIQLPTSNGSYDVTKDTLTYAFLSVASGGTLQIINSSSTDASISLYTDYVHTGTWGGGKSTVQASSNLLNCSGTLILGDKSNASYSNFTLKSTARSRQDGGGSSGTNCYATAMAVSLISTSAKLKMYGGNLVAVSESRAFYAMNSNGRAYALNIDSCYSADIYGGSVSLPQENNNGIGNDHDNATSGGVGYYATIRCNDDHVYIFDIDSYIKVRATADTGKATLNAANIKTVDAADAPFVLGGKFVNESYSDDATLNSKFVDGDYYAADRLNSDSWQKNIFGNGAGSYTIFTWLYMADQYTTNAEWYGKSNFDTFADWRNTAYDTTYTANNSSVNNSTAVFDPDIDYPLSAALSSGTKYLTYKYLRTAYDHTGWCGKIAGTNKPVDISEGISNSTTFEGTGGTVFVHPTWTPHPYDVTYKWNEADNITVKDGQDTHKSSFTQGDYYHIESDKTLHTPTRPGYKFAGWRPTAAVGNWTTDDLYLDTTPLKGKYGDVTFKPEWTPIDYTITFATDKIADGTWSFHETATLRDPAAPEKVVSADAYNSFNLEKGGNLPSVFKPGYTFQNSWKIVYITPSPEGGGASVGKDLNVGAFGSIWGYLTLLANLTPNNYNITYVIPDGAVLSTTAPKTVTFDAAYGELAKAERVGYTFLGWTTVAGSNVPNVNSETIYTTVGDTTLYACWSADGFGVKLYYFNSENQKTPLNDGNAINVQYDSPYGEQLDALQPDDNLRAGWEFVRWYDANGNTVTKDTIYKIDSNSELFAELKESTYYLTFDENGGTSVADFSYKVSDTFELPVSTKTGYILRWKARNSAGRWKEGALYSSVEYTGEYGTVDFVADWTLASYKIILDANGGVCTYGEINYNYETVIDADEFAAKYTPTRTGYSFKGWFVKTSAGSWNEGALVTSVGTQNHENVTLVAQWEKIEYTLTYDLNGGEYEGATEYADTYTIEDQLTLIAPTRTAYTFNYWRVPNDINIGTAWTAGTYYYLTDVLSEKYGDVTLIAEWSPVQYTIAFHADGGSEEWNYSTYNTNQAYTLPDSTKAGYIFKGWMPDADAGNWKADTTYAAGTPVGGQYGNVSFTAQWEVADYTATLDANGGTLDQTTVSYNIQSGADLPTPERAGYAFAGWRVEESVGSWKKDDVHASIMQDNYGDVSLIAVWTPIAYDATFYSQNTLQTALTVEDYTIEGGVTLPAMTRDHYTFMGWQPRESVGSWDASAVYTAGDCADAWGTVQFDAVWEIYTYTVVWQNYDGTVLETDTAVEYGTLPTYDGTAPVKAADAQYTYTFVGWDPAVTPVAGANGTTYVYTAVFAQTVNSYTVTWQYETDENDSTPMKVVTEDVAYGAIPAFKGIPVKESSNSADHVWQFMGWTPAVSPVTGNVTYTAIFEENNNPITITWYIGGEAHKTYGVTGASPVYPTTPVLEKNDGYSYSFVGWAATENGAVLDALPALGTENVNYYAVFDKTAVTYTATLIGNGGTVERETETYAVAEDALELPVPVRNGYTFVGWKPLNNAGNWDANTTYSAGVLGGMLGDVTLVAQWTATEYTVTVYPADGSAEYDITYTIDGTQTLPTITREGHTFTGWYVLLGDGSWKQGQVLDLNESLANNYGNLTVQAQWQVNRYTVTWVIDGTFATETYAYGTAIAQRTVPEKLGYIAAWDQAVPQVMPAENLTITAVYTLREYTITYNANGGEMPASYPTVYNITATDALPVPTKAGSLFAGWQVVSEGGNWILGTTTAASATLAGRYGNVSLKAVWTPTIHEIKWVIEEGRVRIAHWYYGAMPSYDGIPEIEQDAQYTYVFTGWDKEIVTVTGDAVYTAQFDKVLRSYSVTWMLDDKVLEVKDYYYGETPDFSGADPIKPANSLYAYTFAGWSPEIVAVEGPQTYYAQFTVYRFVQSVVLDYSNISLVNGETLQLTVSVYPLNADDPSVEWFSLDESIATVDSNGLVTAVGVGSTSICVRSNENPDLVAFCTVRVTPIFVTWLEITASSTTTLGIGEAVQLGYVLRPDNATNIAVNWVSMDAKVAIVGKTGLVTIVGEGTTKIYCYSADGYCAASISVTGLPEATEEEEEEKYVIVWFPVSQAGGGYIIDGKTFEENTIKFPYGSDIRFQLVNNNGYTVKVNGSGAYYPDEEGYYTIKNVTEDISILVFTSGDNILDDELTNDPDANKSFFDKLGEFFRKIVLWFRSLFGMN